MTPALRLLLVAAHFVCPLLFFTNLTRNPYITQISLLNICLAAAAALWLWRQTSASGALALPKTPLDLPLAALAGTALLSWAVSYFLHVEFFRPAIVNEGLRSGLFLAVNCLAVFYLSSSLEGTDEEPPLLAWTAATVAWGLLWLTFAQVRGPARPIAASAFDLMWDGYGAFLWAVGLAGAFWLCRRGRAADFLHLAFAVGFLASVYGVMQYFSHEIIWPTVLNPYGGRSVSTFGNPNFLSSYNVVLFPLALDRFLRSKGAARGVYSVLLLTLEAALLCSMTRSSWLGAGAAVCLLAFSADLRGRALADARPVGLLASVGVAMALFWPSSSIASGYTPSVIGRLAEVVQAADESTPYSPWHQRILIWSSAWLMGAENPLTGKGFGLFELFYPFYQGQVIDHFEFLRPLRTHANNSHNEVLETWAQGGLLGVGVLFWLWTTFARAAAGRQRTSFAAACGVGGVLVDNLLNVSLHFAVPAFMFWWAAGLALPASGMRVLLTGAAARAAAAASLLAGAACSWQWVRVWNREVLYFTGFKLLKQKALIPGVRLLERSRSWGPPEVNALYELGNGYAQTERYEEAQKTYLEAIEANAGYDEIYYNRGAILAGLLGRREEAIKHFEVALLINPRSNEAYNNLSAQYFSDVGRYGEKTRALLEKALRHYPNDASHWHNLGFLHVQRKDWERAEESFSRALRVSPDFRASEASLLALQRETGKRSPMLDALAVMREVDERIKRQDFSDVTVRLGLDLARRLPDVEKARFLAGSLLLVRGRARESLEHLEWVAKRAPRHSSALTNLGAAYQTLGRREEAISSFRAALAAEPGNGQARARLEALGGAP